MSSKIDVLFLDLDGTLLEDRYRHYQCYKDIILEDKGSPLDLETFWQLKRAGYDSKTIVRGSHYKKSYAYFLEQWLLNIESKKYLAYAYLKPNVLGKLQEWKSISKLLVLVTMRNNKTNLVWQLKQLGIYQTFDHILACPTNRKNTKYEETKNIPFQTAIFIGDTEEDIKTAKLLGIKSIGILNGLRKKELLDADFYANEIEEIDLRSIFPY